MSDLVEAAYLPDSPFPGIDPFGYKDRNVFFARTREIQSLTRLVVLYRGVLLYSDSGNGKSSLLNAGVIPSVLKEGYQPERIRVQPKRGGEIVIQLCEKIGEQTIQYPSIFQTDDSSERLVISVGEFLEALRQHARRARPLLIFDQFEEWVTLFEDSSSATDSEDARKSQEDIQNAICSLINDNVLPVKVLLALREDYYTKLTPFFRKCPYLPDQGLRLLSLNKEQIYEAIRGPFESHPMRFQPEISAGLAKQIQAQFLDRSAGADIRLTEVQIVCRSLFQAEDTDPSELFIRQRGVQGILEQYLDDAVDSLKPEQKGPAIALMSRMVTSAGTRNVISQEDLYWRVELEEAMPRKLLDETLNNLEQEAKLVRRERRRDIYYYEIASEFLVPWILKKAREKSEEEAKIEGAELGKQSYRQKVLARLSRLWAENEETQVTEEKDRNVEGAAGETSIKESNEGNESASPAEERPPSRVAAGIWTRILDPASSSESIVLVVVEGTDRRTLVLDHFPFTIGRSTDRDLVIADPRVMHKHAQIIRDYDGVFIEDHGSRDGTFVNGERVVRRRLNRNDHIEFGVQGGARVVFHPDRSLSTAGEGFLSQFSNWKAASGAGSDLEMLNVFLDAARKLNASGVLDDVLNVLLESALRLTRAERGFVFLRHADGELHLAAGRDKSGESITDDSTISRSVLRDAARSLSEFLVTDTDDTGKQAGREAVVAYNLRSVICFPLRATMIQEKAGNNTKSGEAADVLGVLYLDAPFLSSKLSSVSHDILRTIANGAATLVENASLVQAEDAAKRYRQELAIAAEIQQRLMSVTIPEVPFAKVNAVSYACKDIGGDFFDLVYTDKGLSLIVADVSGKGVSAAVVASSLQAMLHSHLALDTGFPEMMGAVNRFLCEQVGGQKYATVVVARLAGTGELEIMNCGHVPPLLVSSDKVVTLEEGNLPIGLVPLADFQSVRLKMKTGDRLLIVTDGLIEAEDASGEFFGTERLESCAPRGLIGIERAVTAYREDTPLADDLTITEMILRNSD